MRGITRLQPAMRGMVFGVVLSCLLASPLIGHRTADSAVLGAPLATGSSSPSSKLAARSGPFLMVLVADAARYDQFDLTRMPNLRALAARGTRYSNAWVGQLPSITQTSHATLGTGVLPKHHLILGDSWRVPGTNQMSPSLLDGALVRTGYIGKLLQRTKVPSLAGDLHRRYPGSVAVSLSGHKAYAADAMGGGTADFVGFGSNDSRRHYIPSAEPGHVPSPSILKSLQLDLPTYPTVAGVEDAWTTTYALKMLFRYHPQILMVNLPEVDVLGHSAGTNAAIMQPSIVSVDRQIGRIVAAYQRAGMYAQTSFVVTSDHGMVPAARTVQSDRVQRIIEKAGGHILSLGHGDYSTVYFKNPEITPSVGRALAAAAIPHVAAVFVRQPPAGYTLVTSSSLLAGPEVTRAYEHLLATFDSSEAPDLVLLYDENTITMNPFYRRIGRNGDHGGGTWGAQHIPLVLAGPGIKPGYVSTYPARLVDIAPTVETLLGIQPAGMDGAPLADAMMNPPAWASEQQSVEGSTLIPDVQALVREAAVRPVNPH